MRLKSQGEFKHGWTDHKAPDGTGQFRWLGKRQGTPSLKKRIIENEKMKDRRTLKDTDRKRLETM